jgi:hypothetical protein
VTLAPDNAVRSDVAALAEYLHRSVEEAVHWEGHAATVEGRFLRRLAGALSAYEAAYGILSGDGE